MAIDPNRSADSRLDASTAEYAREERAVTHVGALVYHAQPDQTAQRSVRLSLPIWARAADEDISRFSLLSLSTCRDSLVVRRRMLSLKPA